MPWISCPIKSSDIFSTTIGKKVLSSKNGSGFALPVTRAVSDVRTHIDVAKIMDSLRGLAIRSGVQPGEKDIPIFHSVFLDAIKSNAAIHELSLILRFKSKTRDFLRMPAWDGRCI